MNTAKVGWLLGIEVYTFWIFFRACVSFLIFLAILQDTGVTKLLLARRDLGILAVPCMHMLKRTFQCGL